MENCQILKTAPEALKNICDFYVEIPAGREVRLLQITDMQVIDSAQCRYAGRVSDEKMVVWGTDRAKENCYDHISALVAQSRPDLIFITGDITYGEFDDKGTSLLAFRDFMDSLGIPWAPVFGNHDNEAAVGVAWQCEQYAAGEYCLFARGHVTGNGNYTVGIVQGGKLIRILYMIDSNGCGAATDPEVNRHAGIDEDQVAWLADTAARAAQACGHTVPAFAAYHIPTVEFLKASRAAGYESEEGESAYTIGVQTPAKNGDFGCKNEAIGGFEAPENFLSVLKTAGVDGVFVGHCHADNTSILWEGIRWTFGLKTGIYDYFNNGQLGGTEILLPAGGASFRVSHIPALVPYEAPLRR